MASGRLTHRAVGLTSLVCATSACGRDGQQHDEVDEVAWVSCRTERGCELPAPAPTQVWFMLDSLQLGAPVELGRGAGWERLEVLGLGVSDPFGPVHRLNLQLDAKLRLDTLEVLVIRGVEVDRAGLRELLARAPALEYLVCDACTGVVTVDFGASSMLRAVSLEGDLELELVHTEHARQLELFSSTAHVDPSVFTHSSRLRVLRLSVAEGADLTPLASCDIEALWLEPWPDPRGDAGPATLPSGLAALHDVRTLHLHGWGDASGVALDPVLELDALQRFACRSCELGSEPRLPDLMHLDLAGSRMRSTTWAERLDQLASLNLSYAYIESAAGLTALDRLAWLDVTGLWLPDDAELPSAYFVVGHPQPRSEMTARELTWTRVELSSWRTDTVTFTFRSLGQTPPRL